MAGVGLKALVIAYATSRTCALTQALITPDVSNDVATEATAPRKEEPTDFASPRAALVQSLLQQQSQDFLAGHSLSTLGSQSDVHLFPESSLDEESEGSIALWKHFRGMRQKTMKIDHEAETMADIKRLQDREQREAFDGVQEADTERLRPQDSVDKSEKLIVTTGYWRLTNADADQGGLRNGPGGYVRRMHLVMGLNVPIITYGDEFGVTNMGIARGNTTPALIDSVQVPVAELPPCKAHEKMLRANISKYTHQLHMPSVTLGCVWDGKFSLIGRTAREHPEYGWYAWLDIGMHSGPALEKLFIDWGDKPWPNPEKLKQLPRDKISASRTFACQTCKEGQYVPFCHCVAATAFIIPAEIVHEVVDLFYSTLEKCLKDTEGRDEGYPCMSEQVIMTQMEMQRPGLYNFIGKGYGDIAGKMTTELANYGMSESSLFDFLSGADGMPTVMLDQKNVGGLL